MKQIKLIPGGDQPQRLKHPWVLKSAVSASSLKSLKSGDPVCVRSDLGHFLGYGYANPESEIVIRLMSFNESESHFYSSDFILNKILAAAQIKSQMGQTKFSYRLFFAESDGVPGLVIDRYVVRSNQSEKTWQIFSYQVTTAGIDQILMDPVIFFKDLTERLKQHGLSEFEWSETCVLAKNDGSIRKKEGLSIDPPTVQKGDLDLNSEVRVLVRSALNQDKAIELSLNFMSSQKTGLFLDQTDNIARALRVLLTDSSMKNRPLKILDVCSYVGHWSVQIASALKSRDSNQDLEMSLLDQSKIALAHSSESLKKYDIKVKTFEADALKPWNELDRDYDVIVVDPPAFIKAQKDISPGSHAYLKMTLEALGRIKKNGLLVTCSCSAHLSEAEFLKIQRKALLRSGRDAVILERGGPTVDHTHSPFFEQAHYLKMFVYLVI